MLKGPKLCIRLKRISTASSYTPKGQMGASEVHERMAEEPSTSQKLNPEDTGKLFMEAGVSGITEGLKCTDAASVIIINESLNELKVTIDTTQSYPCTRKGKRSPPRTTDRRTLYGPL